MNVGIEFCHSQLRQLIIKLLIYMLIKPFDNDVF